MAINFKEYTRIRDIIVKRNKRAAAAGLMPLIHFPTVKEIRSGYVDPGQALKAVKEYYSSGSQVKAIRQTGLTPPVRTFPQMPPEPKLSTAEKQQRRREYQRMYRQRQKIKQMSRNARLANQQIGYLKALITLQNRGFDLGVDVTKMTATEAQGLVEYLQYRLSQADFENIYGVVEFTKDMGKLVEKGYTPQQIRTDFEEFLESQKAFTKRGEHMEGLSPDEADRLWHKFYRSKMQ